MTPLDVIKKVKEIKPSVLNDSALLSFLNTVESKIRLIINDEKEFEAIPIENIGTAELFLDKKFDDIYLYYLASQIDYFTNDIDSYNNSIILYNTALTSYTNFYMYRRDERPTYKYDYEGAFK